MKARLGAAVVLDVDGVLHKGYVPIPGAREALERLEAARVPFIFVTNSGGESEEDKAARYRQALGWDAISPARLVQSHTPLRGLLPRFADRPVLVVASSASAAASVMTRRALPLVRVHACRSLTARHTTHDT